MKKIILILCGFFIAFISIELVLQTTSFIIIQFHKFENHKKVKLTPKKDVITILCIGESTTFSQYPKLLERYFRTYLSKQYVKVIDCGVSGTNIKNILNTIDDDINKYKPDIVISMMGINDAYMRDTVIYQKKYNLKILELFRLIKRHISNMSNSLYAENVYFDIDNLTIEYIKSGTEPVILENMLKTDSNNPKILRALVCVYRTIPNFTKAEKYANQYMQKYLVVNNDTFVPFALTDIYIRQKKYDSAQDLIFKIITNKNLTEFFIDDYLCKIIESYIKFMPLDKTVDLYNMLAENKVQTRILDGLYAYLKKHNSDVKNYQYYNKFKNLVLAPYFNAVEIKEGYLLFAEKVIKKNIIYICMGYPTIPIEKFKIFFKNSKYKDKIIFVSNEYNFKEKLKKLAFFDLFVDNFGGTFGHCTKLGNKLIAENVGNVILKLVDK
ncbi:MAG: hypothetical protein PHR82_03620 [Endomicrobiaceae bacterium]|nr:hypothetical protein [Endomicrobiaceae bacterium]